MFHIWNTTERGGTNYLEWKIFYRVNKKVSSYRELSLPYASGWELLFEEDNILPMHLSPHPLLFTSFYTSTCNRRRTVRASSFKVAVDLDV